MSKILRICMALSVLFSGFSYATPIEQGSNIRIERKLGEDLRVKQITNTCYLIIHRYPWPANSLLVATDKNRGILIDTPYTPEATEILVRWAENEIGLSDFVFINSEFHVDNLGGNAYGIERGFRIIGSDRCVEMVEEKGQDMMEHTISMLKPGEQDRFIARFKNQRLYPPNDIFALPEAGTGIWQQIDNLKFELFFPGEGHTSENILIFLPGENILFGSNIIRTVNAKGLGNLADDGNIDAYTDSVNRIIEHYRNNRDVIVIPGHGEIGGFALINHTLELSEQQ